MWYYKHTQPLHHNALILGTLVNYENCWSTNPETTDRIFHNDELVPGHDHMENYDTQPVRNNYNKHDKL